MLGGVAGVQLIENLNSVIRYFHCENETIGPNVDGEREEGTAGNLTLSEADHRSGVGIGQKCKLEPIRCDTLGATYASAEHLPPLAKLRTCIARFESTGNRDLHNLECTPRQDFPN